MSSDQMIGRAIADATSIRAEVEQCERLPFATAGAVSESALLVVACAILSELRRLTALMAGAVELASEYEAKIDEQHTEEAVPEAPAKRSGRPRKVKS